MLWILIIFQSIPIVYCLMETKTRTFYVRVILYIKDSILPNFNPQTIVTDFESALRESLTDHFISARAQGCWFHHNQVINIIGKKLVCSNKKIKNN